MKYRKSLMSISLLLLVVMLLVSAAPVSAAEIVEDGNIEKGDVVDDDLFIFGGEVHIDGTVKGTVVAMGDRMIINGEIEGDLLTMGRVVEINPGAVIHGNLFNGSSEVILQGEVRGSVFSGAAVVIVEDGALIGSNLYSGSFSLEVADAAEIERSLYAGAYQIIMAGMVGDDFNVGVEALDLSGSVGGDARVEISDPNPHGSVPYMNFSELENTPKSVESGIHLRPGAKINGELKVVSPVVSMPSFAVEPGKGIIVQTPMPDDNHGQPQTAEDDSVYYRYQHPDNPIAWFLRMWIRTNFGRLFTLLILGALMLWLCRKPLDETIQTLKKDPWSSLGFGVLVYFLGYLLSFVAFLILTALVVLLGIITLGSLAPYLLGIVFPLFAALFTLFVFAIHFISKLVMAYWLGLLILGKPRNKPASAGRGWLAALIGIVIYVFLRAIPMLGWWVGIVSTGFGLGAIWLWCWRWMTGRKRGAADLQPAPAAPAAPLETGLPQEAADTEAVELPLEEAFSEAEEAVEVEEVVELDELFEEETSEDAQKEDEGYPLPSAPDELEPLDLDEED